NRGRFLKDGNEEVTPMPKPKAKVAQRRPTKTAAKRKSPAKAPARTAAKASLRRKPATSIRRGSSSKGGSLEQFNSELVRQAGEIHDKLVTVGPGITLNNAEPPEFYLAQMVKLGVLSETEADELKELSGEVQKNSATANSRVEQMGVFIVKNGKRGHMAQTLAGIAIASAKKAATTKLYSVAGSDFWGAVVGGVAGAVAGEIVTKSTPGAIVGGVAGAIIVGGLASAEA
ncbi:MAG: hypothetical protein ABI992_09880, partial [Chthoniobacterales bacterium]